MERQESVGVQTLLPRPTITRFHEGVVCGLPRSTEVDNITALVRPTIECVRCELRSFVDPNALESSAHGHNSIKHCYHLLAFYALVDLDRQGLTRANVEQCQRAKAPAIEQRIRDEVYQPYLVRRRRCSPLHLMSGAHVPARRFDWQIDPFFTVWAAYTRVAHLQSFPARRNPDPALAIAHA